MIKPLLKIEDKNGSDGIHNGQKDPAMKLSDLINKLHTSLEGLDASDAQNRLSQYGYNEIPEEKVSLFRKLISYLWGPIPWMIEIAAILSLLVQHWADLAVILVLLFVNAGVGFWEEFQAGNAIEALKAKLAIKAKVRRSHNWSVILAREIVPGDVIRVRIGDIVPADAMLLQGDPIEVDQSALTGESLPVTRNCEEVVYSGSIIKRGETDALVYATGKDTYFGKTAQLVSRAHTTSHFQKAVLKIGNYLIVIALILVSLILVVALMRGEPIITTLQFALILTIAAIPVAMPTVLSVTMAVGARLLSIKQIIVSRLAAIEELAGIDTLCTDKTGTLTQNNLTVGQPFIIDKTSQDDLFLYASLASRVEDQDPIDQAILSSSHSDLTNYQVVSFQPFDPVKKRTEAKVKPLQGQAFSVTKGAPQVILELDRDSSQIEQWVDKAVTEFAGRGYRSLGVASSDDSGNWKFMGIIPLYDPPRPDSRETIRVAHQQMGINVKMLTGDQIAIGKEIARQLDLGENFIQADQFSGDGQLSEELADQIERADGFAQVFPEHKYEIVETLQKRGHIVGMTGDGVNDAPALKEADAGIAVSGATDAARAAADIVLLTPGLSVIIDAIKESRKIFQRMNSYAIYRIAETIRVLLFMTLSILVFNFYPVTAIMIVLLALMNDGAIISIAYDRVWYKNSPEKWNMRMVLGIATVLGVMGVISSFGLFYLGDRVFHLNRELLQTLMYLKLSVAGHLTIFVTRTRKSFWSIRPSKILLLAVSGTQLLATFIAVYGVFMTPLGWTWALIVWGYAIAWFLVNDQVKQLAYKYFDPQPTSSSAVRSPASQASYSNKMEI